MPKIGENLSQYIIISAIGVGGMGEVFLAEDKSLGRKAALKFLSAEFASEREHLDRFFREARAASALNHPNICTIYEINETGDVPFIAMEYIEGETVAEMIRRRRRNVRQTLDIAVQVAEALAEAHANGIVHRDIKPANIIFNQRGHVKILDFGLAKKTLAKGDDGTREHITSAGVILGTASYMSPEQARGLDVDGRSDIWSFGVCLYEMLTGKQPFTGDTVTDTFAAILTREPIPPSVYFADIPADLDPIVLKTLSKSKDSRYQNAGELASELQALQKRLEFDNGRSKAAGFVSFSDEKTEEFDAASTDYDIPRVTDEDLKKQNLRPNNLTVTYSQIIGREKEIVSISRLLLQDDVRLVTMTGIGGTGKTRLARAVAERMLLDFDDGVFFVEMAAVTQPEVVASTIAQPLGIKEEAGRPVLEMLKEHLRDKQMLIVIDNFEQVIDSAPQVAELLTASDSLKILVTSREVLRVTTEIEFPVPPLIVPEPASGLSFDELKENEAIRLFTDRAMTSKPTFALTPDNAADIAAVCARLDGLPLAIELAAARTKVLSPAAILSKLENRLNLLTGGARDLPERQQTMRGAVAWSYDLLSEFEKEIFRKLSVFSGGFRIESAEIVCGTSDGMEVLDAVTSLIDKSLLIQKEFSDGELRFRLLEVVRDFAAELLESNGETDALSRKHAEVFVSLTETAEPILQTAESAVWLGRLEEEHDNIRAALRWSLANDPSMAVRLAVAARNYWLVHSHLTEGFGWLKAASETGFEPPPAQKFKLLNGLGLAARFRGDYETARRAYDDGLAAGKEANDKQGIALSHRGLGLVAMQQNDLVSARRHFDEGLAISRELDDKFGIAISLSFLGDLARTEGRNAEARPQFEEAVELFRALENKTALGDALNNLGAATFSLGDSAGAKACFSEALTIAKDLINRITISCSLDGFAAIAVESGDHMRAARLSGAADNLRDLIGYKIEPAESRFRDMYLSKLKDVMLKDSFDTYYTAGRRSGLEGSIVEALEHGTSGDIAESLESVRENEFANKVP